MWNTFQIHSWSYWQGVFLAEKRFKSRRDNENIISFLSQCFFIDDWNWPHIYLGFPGFCLFDHQTYWLLEIKKIKCTFTRLTYFLCKFNLLYNWFLIFRCKLLRWNLKHIFLLGSGKTKIENTCCGGKGRVKLATNIQMFAILKIWPLELKIEGETKHRKWWMGKKHYTETQIMGWAQQKPWTGTRVTRILAYMNVQEKYHRKP